MQRPLLLLIILFVMPLFSACSLFPKAPRFESDGAQEQIDQLTRLNEEVTTFKGTGSVVITEKGKTQRFRIAWAGAVPNLLRMEILTSATPIESLAYDGERLQLRSHMGSHAPYTKKVKNPSLEPVTGIPLTLSEIHALLSGKFYVGDVKSARLLTSNDGTGTLILHPDRRHKKTITLDEHLLPTGATLTAKGEEIYDIRFTRKATSTGVYQYKTIILTTTKGIDTTIRIDRMIVNPPVEKDIFTLAP
ncbi:hypothetical protein DSLASN_20390 [Desulfoluna limicola]|uniref:DUF4292 domain-containing protein n=1 Tax=Desulfoluna limicola TaxID=2810562 RepID=A0ABN6F4I8_9BACT|nr:hypothetical protein [Desulfoluna limicola]BCS96407.1 hypothetical protein DSLASN_20390 [Desulfoluna limicola]